MLRGDRNGKDTQKEGTREQVWLIHFAAQKKATQQGNGTISSKNICKAANDSYRRKSSLNKVQENDGED